MPVSPDTSGRRPGLYVHIPFCARKCHYCDFNSWPDGTLPEGAESVYFARLRREAGLLVPPVLDSAAGAGGFQTLYLGGGTPSAVEPFLIGELLDTLGRWIDISGLREVTLEANPESLTREKLARYRGMGIGRVSLGVQTFQPDVLKTLGRVHDVPRAETALELLAGSGFESWSLDLMYGLPGQTVEGFAAGLRRVLAYRPPHLSMYGLTVETGTEFGRLQKEGKLGAPDSDFQADCFEAARGLLAAAGYRHYEISNFALPGHEAVHNSLYWRRIPYLALGAGAHGFWPGEGHSPDLRWSVPRPFERHGKYVEGVAGTGELASLLAPVRGICPEWREVDRGEAFEEAVFLGLRLLDEGISLEELGHEFGTEKTAGLLPRLERAAGRGEVELKIGCWRLAPRSVLLANRVIAGLLGD